MKKDPNNIHAYAASARWRAHCRRQPAEFSQPVGNAQQVRRIEHFESQALTQLLCEFEPLEIRAAAMRHIAALRDCSVRQVAMFFEIATEVVVVALSLQPEAVATIAVEPPQTLVKAA